MRLVFIHGIHEEHKSPDALRRCWEDSLLSAWDMAGLAKPAYTLEMPYYGNLLARLAARARGMVHGVHSGVAGLLTRVEHRLIRDIGKVMGFEATHLRNRIAERVVRSDIAEREWVQGFFRLLDSDVPGFSPLLLSFTRQVDAYLTSSQVRSAVDNVVRPSLLAGPTVIVAHSLGSVIAYRLLRQAEEGANVPLLVTLGSPLGICTIKEHLSPPSLAVPAAVRSWLNATDEKDCVALHARLDRDTFVDGIENIADVHHLSDNPHEVSAYLGHPTVAERIHTALCGTASSTRRERGAEFPAHAGAAQISASPHRTPG